MDAASVEFWVIVADIAVGSVALAKIANIDQRLRRVARRVGVVEKITGVTPPAGVPIVAPPRAATEPGRPPR